MFSNFRPIRLAYAEKDALARRGYKIGKALGKGTFGVVFRADHYDKPCAVKAIDLGQSSAQSVCIELFILKNIRHPNVVCLMDFYRIKTNHLLIFMELLSGGDLWELVQENKLTEDQVAELYNQFGGAVAFMHSCGFAHRDLKPENILLDESKKVAKVADFGMSKQCYDTCTGKALMGNTACGSPAYIAPEVLKLGAEVSSQPYCPFTADVWSIGIILYEMLHDSIPPFKPLPDVNGLFSYKNALYEINRQKIQFFDNVSKAARQFITRHLVIEPSERPSMETLLQDRWLLREGRLQTQQATD